MECPKCQFGNREGANFCIECGVNLELACSECGNVYELDSKFCDECGFKFDHDIVTEKRESNHEGERKHATVLFTDLSGYTALSERLDPEEVKEITSRIFGEITQIIARYDGFIEKYAGDAIMVLFGVPDAHEDDPIRAIRAAMEIHGLIADISPQYKEKIAQPLLMHTGINTGLVVTGEVNFERGTHGVSGDTINQAFRLSDLAEAGEILVGLDTYRQARGYFSFKQEKQIKVKGKRTPLLTFSLVDLVSKHNERRKPIIKGLSSSLVGRKNEMASVISCIENLKNGKGGIVSIIGEAGLGKSRFMAEIYDKTIRAKSASSPLWLEGRCVSYSHTISYLPFQEILSFYAGISEEDSETEAWRKLESGITELFEENTVEVLPYLASLLTFEVKGDYTKRVKYLDSEAMRHQIFLSSRRFFECLAQTKPLVLVFEDLQWIDASSALLLDHLFPLVERSPLLIFGVSRPDRKTPAIKLREIAKKDFANCYTEIRLGPLSQNDSENMVGNLLRVGSLIPRVKKMILNKAEGNPFFLEEIIRSLIDEGAVVYDPSGECWQVTAKAEVLTIPDTIQGVVAARIDRLDEDIKKVLRSAAVIGRRFPYLLLRTIKKENRKLDEQLVELQEIEIIREKQKEPELEYTFKHALVQEVTYETILLKKRRKMHAQVGQAIEALFADRIEEFYSLLAYHYAQAEVWEKAHDYLLKSGDQAWNVAADSEALSHYEKAITAYEKVFSDKWDPLQRASLTRRMGEAFFRRGQHQQATEYLNRALSYLGKQLPNTRWGIRRAILKELIKQVCHRLLSGLFLRPKIAPAIPNLKEEFRMYEALSWIDAFANQELFLLEAIKQLNVSERNGYTYGIVVGSAMVGLTFNFMNAVSLAKYYHHQAVAHADKLQHPLAAGRAYIGLGYHEFFNGKWDAVIKYSRRAAHMHLQAGDLRGWGMATNFQAYALAYQSKFEEALVHCQELIQFGQEGADSEVWCWGVYPLGFINRRKGKLQTAIANLRQAIALSESVPDYLFRVMAGGELAQCYLCKGRWQDALEILIATEGLCVKHNVKGNTITPLRNGLAEAYLMAARNTSISKSEMNDWIKKADHACEAALRLGKTFRPALPEAMLLKGRYENLMGRKASAMNWLQRSLKLAGEMGQRYDLARTHLEMHRSFKKRRHLDHAERIFAEIGVDKNLSHVTEAL